VTLLLVSGTGTGVGKTVVTAAVAALARDAGRSVAVVKPAQTGLREGEPGDVAEVVRLAGLSAADGHELSRYRAALAPATAARLERADGPALDDVAAVVERLVAANDLVLVEGAGGLLVRFDATGWTLADLAVRLAAPVLVVVAAGLGTLNHTALTAESLRARGVEVAGLVVGAWPALPAEPDLAERANLADLPEVAGVALLGVLPAGMAALDAAGFLAAAGSGLAPDLGGELDAADFARAHGLPAAAPADRKATT
jgi:dethiobiotin synthetase